MTRRLLLILLAGATACAGRPAAGFSESADSVDADVAAETGEAEAEAGALPEASTDTGSGDAGLFDDAGMCSFGWGGDCAACALSSSCGAGALGFTCPTTCAAPPPTLAAGSQCTDIDLTPADAALPPVATLLYCCLGQTFTCRPDAGNQGRQ